MIHVLITVKPSSRFPGKNRKLFRYTLDWLWREMSNSCEAVSVYIVGDRSELDEVPLLWKCIEAKGTHLEVIKQAEEVIDAKEGDAFVLAQLTQPIRRLGLLKDVVESARAHGSAVTACESVDNSWRVLSDSGSWKAHETASRLLLDGALYAWTPGNVSCIFTPNIVHGVVLNYCGSPVDIDYEENIPSRLDHIYSRHLNKSTD